MTARQRLGGTNQLVGHGKSDGPRLRPYGDFGRQTYCGEGGYLDPLIEAEIIVEFTDRGRNRAWRAPDFLGALDAFAERVGRRGLLG